MEFLTAPPVSLVLALMALVLVIMFGKHTFQQIEALEETALETGSTKDMRAIRLLRLKISGVWFLFLVPATIALLSLP